MRERAKLTYAFRSLLDAGARLAFGSDWFVAPPTPLEGIYAAVTRRTLDGKNPGGWIPEQRITVEEALRAYTRDAAFASFEETRKGNARARQARRLRDDRSRHHANRAGGDRAARVVMTVVGGRVVHRRGATSDWSSRAKRKRSAAIRPSPPQSWFRQLPQCLASLG